MNRFNLWKVRDLLCNRVHKDFGFTIWDLGLMTLKTQNSELVLSCGISHHQFRFN